MGLFDGWQPPPGLFTRSTATFPNDAIAQAVMDRWNEVVAQRKGCPVGSLGGLLAELIAAGVRAQSSLPLHQDNVE